MYKSPLRKTKLALCKQAAIERTPESTLKYKTYRNLFNTLMRKSKKMYFDTGLQNNRKNPKKTWEILREAIGKKPCVPISEIKINGTPSNDPTQIANEFNNFFLQNWFKNCPKGSKMVMTL
jgi:hypothetical protein